jgi:hypothetical protein
MIRQRPRGLFGLRLLFAGSGALIDLTRFQSVVSFSKPAPRPRPSTWQPTPARISLNAVETSGRGSRQRIASAAVRFSPIRSSSCALLTTPFGAVPCASTWLT